MKKLLAVAAFVLTASTAFAQASPTTSPGDAFQSLSALDSTSTSMPDVTACKTKKHAATHTRKGKNRHVAKR